MTQPDETEYNTEVIEQAQIQELNEGALSEF